MRAVLIAGVIAVALVEGCPLPGKEQARRLGVERLVTGASATRDAVLTPFRPVFRALDFSQRWSLFPVADKRHYRMVIEARPGPETPWQVLYRVHGPERAAFADVLEYRRIRGIWNPGAKGPRGAYKAFCSWIARVVFEADPRLREARVKMERVRVLPGGAGVEPTGEEAFAEVRRR